MVLAVDCETVWLMPAWKAVEALPPLALGHFCGTARIHPGSFGRSGALKECHVQTRYLARPRDALIATPPFRAHGQLGVVEELLGVVFAIFPEYMPTRFKSGASGYQPDGYQPGGDAAAHLGSRGRPFHQDPRMEGWPFGAIEGDWDARAPLFPWPAVSQSDGYQPAQRGSRRAQRTFRHAQHGSEPGSTDYEVLMRGVEQVFCSFGLECVFAEWWVVAPCDYWARDRPRKKGGYDSDWLELSLCVNNYWQTGENKNKPKAARLLR